MNQANKSTRIFLSYAKEDESKVDEIYQFLQRTGFKPWMSKYDILPGQDWREDISDEIIVPAMAVQGRLRDDLTYDGVHLTARGYAIWAEHLRAELRRLLPR